MSFLEHVSNNLSGYLTLLSTFILGAVAIFQESMRPNAKLGIKPSSLTDDELNTDAEGNPRIYFLITVENKRKFLRIPGKGCGVFLMGISRIDEEGKFSERNIQVPWQLQWAPAEIAAIRQTISRESVCGFGYLSQKDNAFIPSLYVYPNTFGHYGVVRPGETARYTVQVLAENYFDNKKYVIEVRIEKEANGNIENLHKHSIVKLIEC